MLRSNHYELAFAQYLQTQQLGYVAVNEHQRARLAEETLKSLDFIVSVPGRIHLLIDIKGRKNQTRSRAKSFSGSKPTFGHRSEASRDHTGGSLASPVVASHSIKLPAMNWVTSDDIHGLSRWQQQFGQDFTSLFVFSHILPRQSYSPQLTSSSVEYQGKNYYFSGVTLKDYTLFMQQRSKKWNTWWLKQQDFRRLAQPISSFLHVAARSS